MSHPCAAAPSSYASNSLAAAIIRPSLARVVNVPGPHGEPISGLDRRRLLLRGTAALRDVRRHASAPPARHVGGRICCGPLERLFRDARHSLSAASESKPRWHCAHAAHGRVIGSSTRCGSGCFAHHIAETGAHARDAASTDQGTRPYAGAARCRPTCVISGTARWRQ